MKTEVYKIGGMSCASCSASVERVTRALDGVEESNVNLATGKMIITYDESRLNAEAIIKEVEDIGFDIAPELEGSTLERARRSAEEISSVQTAAKPAAAIALSFLIMFISMGHMLIPGMARLPLVGRSSAPLGYALVQMILAIVVIFIGRRMFVRGFSSLFLGVPSMDSLVALSSTASFVYSAVMTVLIASGDISRVSDLYFESSAMVLGFVMLGKQLEGRSIEKTKGAISGLMKLVPDKATLIKDGEAFEINASELAVGNVVLVKPGERIPMDGLVTGGSGSADESMFTGESMPVYKDVGSAVTGGSINLDGVLYVKVTRVGDDTTLAKIIRIVEDAQGKKAPIAKLADKIVGKFVPVVICIAVIAAIIMAICTHNIGLALKVFTSVLVIACPCALGLATPIAIIVGTGLGAGKGILIRSGEALETVCKADTVVFDKTGTLTEGRPVLSDAVTSGIHEAELLRICASAEQFSDHPLARAVVDKAGTFEAYELSEFVNVSGQGVTAEIKGAGSLALGNSRLMANEDIDIDEFSEFYREKTSEGKSVMFAALSGKLAGAFAFSDTVRPESAEAVKALKEMGLKTILLTGDNKRAAKYIASQIDIDDVNADVLPQDKSEAITELQEDGSKVIMVGDGINDAPALAAADVGIAIGSGSDIAIESADIVLVNSNPMDVVSAVRISRLTLRNIKQNLFWALFYNCIGIPIAAGALYPINGMLLSPMIGAMAMACSSIFVVTNALRLKTKAC